MIVYVLFHETNTGHSDESDGYVEAIYATEEAAEAAKLAAIRKARDEGEAIYFDPDTKEDFPDDWEHDWHVEAHEVLIEAADDGEDARESFAAIRRTRACYRCGAPAGTCGNCGEEVNFDAHDRDSCKGGAR